MTTDLSRWFATRRAARTRRTIWRKKMASIGERITSFGDVGQPVGGSTWSAPDAPSPSVFRRDPKRLGEDLVAIWEQRGRPQLTPLAHPIAALAELHRSQRLNEGNGRHNEVSSDVYAMQ